MDRLHSPIVGDSTIAESWRCSDQGCTAASDAICRDLAAATSSWSDAFQVADRSIGALGSSSSSSAPSRDDEMTCRADESLHSYHLQGDLSMPTTALSLAYHNIEALPLSVLLFCSCRGQLVMPCR